MWLIPSSNLERLRLCMGHCSLITAPWIWFFLNCSNFLLDLSSILCLLFTCLCYCWPLLSLSLSLLHTHSSTDSIAVSRFWVHGLREAVADHLSAWHRRRSAQGNNNNNEKKKKKAINLSHIHNTLSPTTDHIISMRELIHIHIQR